MGAQAVPGIAVARQSTTQLMPVAQFSTIDSQTLCALRWVKLPAC
jgi:hypothetical protein